MWVTAADAYRELSEAERRNSVTRPQKGNEWKRDAKAGFTGVILFGHTVILNQSDRCATQLSGSSVCIEPEPAPPALFAENRRI